MIKCSEVSRVAKHTWQDQKVEIKHADLPVCNCILVCFSAVWIHDPVPRYVVQIWGVVKYWNLMLGITADLQSASQLTFF